MSQTVSSSPVSSNWVAPYDTFLRRHLGPSEQDVTEMLDFVGYGSLNELADKAIPARIRTKRALQLPAAKGESEAVAELKRIMSKNKVWRSFIGQGYSPTITPPVIQRNILENPGWYTSYTPYQAEISQGRLEALLNYQTMVIELTGLEIANASLLDEGTAAAEAMAMCLELRKNDSARKFFVARDCFAQTIDVIQTRALPLGIEVVIGNAATFTPTSEFFAALLQNPAEDGTVRDLTSWIDKAHAAGVLAIVAADPLSLCLLKTPADMGADIAVGSTQRFGVPLGFGGPHAAYLATRDSFKRSMPGRLIGVSHDSHGRHALRLSLQTREQHIRRDKATSNICTAQVLLAVMASMYAVYHGPEGLKAIAERTHLFTALLAKALRKCGFEIEPESFFDTLTVRVGRENMSAILQRADQFEINLWRRGEEALGISLNEAATLRDIADLVTVFAGRNPFNEEALRELAGTVESPVAASLHRATPCLKHTIFKSYHTEHELLRYLHRLQSRDLSLTGSMIPLGSCTMKLNATSEMVALSWPEVANLHPFAPESQTAGYREMFKQLEAWLGEITGFPAISLQPNAGSQGEYAGLLAIRAYHAARSESHRTVCLIPVSAHGTNPASAVMAGFRVVAVACDTKGNVDLADLAAKATQHKDELACIMITYPSTHGVFEDTILDVSRIVHENGGQVYMDGANLNALVGLVRPAELGIDVCHLNLHKTFCIPHGGGGPGVGPIGVAQHLAAFLPGHILIRNGAEGASVCAAPWGSASITTISWAYIAMLGGDGLTYSTQIALLGANYVARQLDTHFPVLYKGNDDLVAHECILDFRQWKKAGVEVEDVAKRLMDYGFHAPTMSWPVPGTLMVEPTESESKAELDRFCDSMIAIRDEIRAVEQGEADPAVNVLKGAPHTAEAVSSEAWNKPYSREQAAYPMKHLRQHKYWPPVGRVDNVFGDRNLICSCPTVEEMAG
jgi:glycine dehydrogenase